MKFDNVMAEINGFGRFQQRTIFLLVIPRMTLPFHFLLNNFIATIPAHHCDISALDDGGLFRNLSLEERLAVSVPVQQDGSPNSCQMFAEPQYHLLLNSSSNLTDLPTVPCQNGWMFDTTTFKSTLAMEWDLVCDKKPVNSATATIFFMGVMVGAAIFGYLSDRFGRKKMLLLSYIITALFGFASAFAHSFPMFAAMRFFTGLGLSGISIISMVLNIEWVDIKHRTGAGVLMSMDWSVSTAVLPILAYFVRDWRYLTATVTTPLLVAIICWWWLPESARWLISNGKVNDAHFYLSKCAEVNNREDFLFTLQVLSKVILVEKENRKYSYLDLVKTPKMRALALFSGIVWFGVTCTYYGISLNVSGFGVNIYLTQFIYGTLEIPGKLLVLYTLHKIGRRLTQVGMLILTGLCICINLFIPQGKYLGNFRTAVGGLGKMFSEASFTTIFLYTSELYPTVMRQNGLGYCSFMARLGVSISPLMILLEDVWAPLPSIIFALVAFTAALSASFLAETRNIRLPETIEDVEQRRYWISLFILEIEQTHSLKIT
uniref:Solute carrier family 22 member 6 n=1 Tax=Amphiprion percula TaxID=161767 RepID=A0A3P8TFT5_AMPPE